MIMISINDDSNNDSNNYEIATPNSQNITQTQVTYHGLLALSR